MEHDGLPVTSKVKPKPDEVVIKIRLGNDAMQTELDIAVALREVAAKLEMIGIDNDIVIMDVNGNGVGYLTWW